MNKNHNVEKMCRIHRMNARKLQKRELKETNNLAIGEMSIVYWSV